MATDYPILVGRRITADVWNTATYRPWCKVRQTTAQTGLLNGSTTVITFTTEDYDVLGWHDNVTNTSRVTPTIAGDYEVIAMTAIAGTNTLTAIFTQINLNGSLVTRSGNYKPKDASSSLSAGGPTQCDIVTCNGTTDYIEMAVGLSTTAASEATNVSSTGRSILIVKYLGPTG